MEVMILANHAATVTPAFAYTDLDYSPRGYSCDTLIGDEGCPEPAFVDYRDNPEYDDRTYKCQEHAPAFPDTFHVYDVYFDWEAGLSGGERRVVTGVIARGVNEALLLYRAFVGSSRLVEDSLGDQSSDDEAGEWNENVMLIDERATEEQFLDYIESAIALDKALAPSFEDFVE
jgi:hypothetical protein